MSLKYFLLLIILIFNNILHFIISRDIYYSIDNSVYKQSILMKDFNLTKCKFHFNEMSFNENLNIKENNFTFDVINSKPPQDLEFEIFEKNKTDGIEKLTNFTINEYIHNSNIFYERSNLIKEKNRNIIF